MPGASGFRRDMAQSLKTFTNQAITRMVQSPDAEARVKKFVDQRVKELIAAGEPPLFQMFVNNRETDSFSGVSFQGGVITVKFAAPLNGVAVALAAHAKEISIRRSGAYADAWVIIVNGIPWTDLSKPIPSGSVVYITNFAPYARKREEQGRFGRSGRLKSYARPETVVTEITRLWGRKKFPGVDIERTYVAIPGAGHSVRGWQVPYVLKRGQHAGEEILYPALRVIER